MLLFVGPENGSVISRTIVPLISHTGDISATVLGKECRCETQRYGGSSWDPLLYNKITYARVPNANLAVYYFQRETLVLLLVILEYQIDTGGFP